MWVYQENLKYKSSFSCTRNNQFRGDNINLCHNFSTKISYLTIPFAIKQNKRIKFKGVWKHYDWRHFIRLPPHLGEALSSMIQEKQRKEKKKEEESSQFGSLEQKKWRILLILTGTAVPTLWEFPSFFDQCGTAVPYLARAVPAFWTLEA